MVILPAVIPKAWIDRSEESFPVIVFETEAYYNNNTNLKREIEELLAGLEEEYLKKEFNLAMVNLQKAEQSRDSAEVLKYLEECQRISQRINVLKQLYEKK